MRSNIEKGQAQPRRNLFILIVLGVYLILSLLMFDPKLFTGGDNVVYVILSQSICSGKGYKDLYLPGEPPHTQYPFGFPLMLVPFVLMFGANIVILKLVVLLTGLGALYFMVKICEKLFKDSLHFLIASYVSIPIMITYNHWILSEMPFVFLSLAAVYLLMNAEDNREIFNYLAFMCSIYAVFIRTAGIALIIGIILWLLLKRRYKQLVIFLILFLLVFIPWQMRTAGVDRSGGYVEQLLAKNPYQMELGRINALGFLERIWENILYYAFKVLPSALLPVLHADILLIIVGAFFTILVTLGFITRIKRYAVFDVYFVFAVIVILAWPKVWSSDRFLMTILPILVIYIYSGLFWITSKIKVKFIVEAFAGLIICLNVVGMAPIVRSAMVHNTAYLRGDRRAGYSLDWRRYFELIEWARRNTPAGSVIIARKPEFVYLLSGRKSFIYPFTTDHDRIREAIAGCDYIILDNFTWTVTTLYYLLPVLEDNPENYRIIKRTERPEFYLLKVVTDS
ncbi:MAG: hypothetical protein OEV79_10210 [candidate division WOR-3 bacterium]|nr:hypothetical protein [candidate division WOR-3 bacterium]